MNSTTLATAAVRQFILHELSALHAAEKRIEARMIRARGQNGAGSATGFAGAVSRLQRRAEMLDRLLDELEPRTAPTQGEFAAA